MGMCPTFAMLMIFLFSMTRKWLLNLDGCYTVSSQSLPINEIWLVMMYDTDDDDDDDDDSTDN
jgi:hypothetical protein